MKTQIRTCGFFVLIFCLATDVALVCAQFPPITQRHNAWQRNQQTPDSILRYAARELDSHRPFPRLPGEFEPQRAIVLSVSDLMAHHNGVLVQIVKKTSGRVPLVILFNDQKQLTDTVTLLSSIGCDLSHVSFYHLKLDTIWLRDFGPRVAETARGAMSLDFFYDGQRPLDDSFPIRWGEQARAEVRKVPWTLHGGNLLCNGKGLGIATSRIFEDNLIRFPNPTPGMNVEFERRKIVVDAFKEDCNVNELIILEPLESEATQHVDMFATFLAADQVLVAQLDHRRDPVNARILDNNAKRLSEVKINGRPLRVARIPIPERDGKYWSPYTNVIFANKLILMPIYKSDPPAMIENAVSVYRRLLPGFHVDTVDMTSMRALEGALHCMSTNVPQFAELPKGVFTFSEAVDRVRSSGIAVRQKVNHLEEKGGSENQTAIADAFIPASIPDSVNQETTNQEVDTRADSQLAAANTYRRVFVDRSRHFSVDAYAIGVDSDLVRLLRVDSKNEISVATQLLCDEDRQWLSRNLRRIRDNGDKVKKLVVSAGK